MGGRGRGRGRGKFGGRGGRAASGPNDDINSQAIQINLVIPTQQGNAHQSMDRGPQEISYDDHRPTDSRHGHNRNQRHESYGVPTHDVNAYPRQNDFRDHASGPNRGPQHDMYRGNGRHDPYPGPRPDHYRDSRQGTGRDFTGDPQRSQSSEYRGAGQPRYDQGAPTAMRYDAPYNDPMPTYHGDQIMGDRWHGGGPVFQGPMEHHHHPPPPNAHLSYRQDPRAYRRGPQADSFERGAPSPGNAYGPGVSHGTSSRRYPSTADDLRPPPYESLGFDGEGRLQGREGPGMMYEREPGRGRGEGRGHRGGLGRGGERGRGGQSEARGRRGGRGSAEGGRGRGGGRGFNERGRGRGGGRGRGQDADISEVDDMGHVEGRESAYKEIKEDKLNKRGQNRRRQGKSDKENKADETRERSSSPESVSSSCTGISGDQGNKSGVSSKAKSSQKAKRAIVTETSDKSVLDQKHDLCQTKTSITIKKHFENVDQLRKVLEKHFQTKNRDGELNFLEETAICSEKESICIIEITAQSKQQAKRLIKNMCQSIHRDLKVLCFFCVSSWKGETEKKFDFQQRKKVAAPKQDKATTEKQESGSESAKQTESGTTPKQKTKTADQSVSKLAITITKGFGCTEHLVQFLQEAAGELSSNFSEGPASVSHLDGLTVCEYIIVDKVNAQKIAKALNLASGVKATCMPHKIAVKEQDGGAMKIKAAIEKASLQMKESTENELARHAMKIESTGKSLIELQSSLSCEIPVDEEQRAQEVNAYIDKLKEMKSQKIEFENRIEKLENSLGLLRESTPSQKDVDSILRDVGIECKRLSAGLPMYARRSDVIKIVGSDQVSIILGETGSGKSTQLAQYLWEEGLAGSGKIVCTQPRKVAAITLGERVSTELVRTVGSLVGYKSGMREKSSKDTKILFCTDHSLLNECLLDPILSKYSCIIIDEAHERSIYTDILLGMIKSFLPRRPDLKLIITSATINPKVFIRYFNTTPELRVSGRAFPVDIIYEDSDDSTPFENYEKKALNKVIEIHDNPNKGDILVFLASAAEIMRCCQELMNLLAGRTDFVCLPLHDQLSPEEQRKVFKPPEEGKRKIIFSTNCAETSITIDGIKFVVDTGVVNEMRYDPRKNMSTLGTQIVSQSSADQRKGRAGRTSSGTCYRLYTEASYESMVTTNQPEILRVHLGQAVLKLAELGVDVWRFDFIESPENVNIESALNVLQEVKALTVENNLITSVGNWLTKLPFEPCQSYVIYLGHKEELLYEAITLVTLISKGSDLIYRGLNDTQEQGEAQIKYRFGSLHSELFMWFSIYKTWISLPKTEQTSWCHRNCVNYKVLNQVKRAIWEVRQILTKELNIKFEFNYSDDEESLDNLRQFLFKAKLASLC